MRYVVGLVLALALAAMGCSETSGTGGVAGDGGSGGDGGAAGEPGSGGSAGVGGGAEPGPQCKPACDDGDACTGDYCACDPEARDCDSAPGVCMTFPLDCDDRNDCTTETCDPSSGCSVAEAEDGTPCAGGSCESGECVLSSDRLPCTEDGLFNAVRAGGGPYTFDCTEPTTVNWGWAAPPLSLDKDVVLDGEGNLSLGSDFLGHASSLLRVPAGTVAVLRQMASLPKLRNSGILRIERSTLTLSNEKLGTAIISIGALEVVESTLGSTFADTVVNDGGDLTVDRSTIKGNVHACGGTTTIVNSTLSAVWVTGVASVQSSTIANHNPNVGWIQAAPASSWIDLVSGEPLNSCDLDVGSTLEMRASILDGTCDPGIDLDSRGSNAASSDSCLLDHSTDLRVDPSPLGPLQDNGGPTETRALEAGSVAIDQIPEAECLDADGQPLTTDQRGVTRPQGSACDVGAVEMEVTP